MKPMHEKELALPASLPLSLEEMVSWYLRRYFQAHGEELPPSGVYDRILPLVERPLIHEALRCTHGNQLKAAALLGINRNTLRKKIQTLGIKLTEEA